MGVVRVRANRDDISPEDTRRVRVSVSAIDRQTGERAPTATVYVHLERHGYRYSRLFLVTPEPLYTGVPVEIGLVLNAVAPSTVRTSVAAPTPEHIFIYRGERTGTVTFEYGSPGVYTASVGFVHQAARQFLDGDDREIQTYYTTDNPEDRRLLRFTVLASPLDASAQLADSLLAEGERTTLTVTIRKEAGVSRPLVLEPEASPAEGVVFEGVPDRITIPVGSTRHTTSFSLILRPNHDPEPRRQVRVRVFIKTPRGTVQAAPIVTPPLTIPRNDYALEWNLPPKLRVGELVFAGIDLNRAAPSTVDVTVSLVGPGYRQERELQIVGGRKFAPLVEFPAPTSAGAYRFAVSTSSFALTLAGDQPWPEAPAAVQREVPVPPLQLVLTAQNLPSGQWAAEGDTVRWILGAPNLVHHLEAEERLTTSLRIGELGLDDGQVDVRLGQSQVHLTRSMPTATV